MSAATVNHTTLQKAFLEMMSATVPGEAMAARDAVLRLARCDPHELTAWVVSARKRSVHDVQKMARDVWHWFMWGDYRDLSKDEEDFVRTMMDAESPSIQQVWRLETFFARTEEENV
jgi:hypothetical protein